MTYFQIVSSGFFLDFADCQNLAGIMLRAKITECFPEIVQILLIFLCFESSNVDDNKNPLKMSTSGGFYLNTYTERIANINKLLIIL